MKYNVLKTLCDDVIIFSGPVLGVVGGFVVFVFLIRWLLLWLALVLLPWVMGAFSGSGGSWCKLLGLKQFLHSPGFQTCSVKVLQADIFKNRTSQTTLSFQCMAKLSSVSFHLPCVP